MLNNLSWTFSVQIMLPTLRPIHRMLCLPASSLRPQHCTFFLFSPSLPSVPHILFHSTYMQLLLLHSSSHSFSIWLLLHPPPHSSFIPPPSSSSSSSPSPLHLPLCSRRSVTRGGRQRHGRSEGSRVTGSEPVESEPTTEGCGGGRALGGRSKGGRARGLERRVHAREPEMAKADTSGEAG